MFGKVLWSTCVFNQVFLDYNYVQTSVYAVQACLY